MIENCKTKLKRTHANQKNELQNQLEDYAEHNARALVPVPVAEVPGVAPPSPSGDARKSSTCTVRWSHGVETTSLTMKSSTLRESSAHTKKKEMGLKQYLIRITTNDG
jgi:hypothetical protein